jgi:hypothetical protein
MQAETESNIPETEAARKARLAAAVDRSVQRIRETYEDSKRTPQEHAQKSSEAFESMISMQEEKYKQGTITLENLTFFKDSMAAVSNFANIPEEEYEKKPEGYARWTLNHTDYGTTTITSEGCRHWRNATVSDGCGAIVFDFEEFGEFDDLEYEPDEEFPDESHAEAIVYYQSGKNKHAPWASNDLFEELLVVPTQVLKEIKDEAPPGSFFSGTSTRGSNLWSPAPEGQVWLDHPHYEAAPKLVSYFEYYLFNRNIQTGGLSLNNVPAREVKFYDEIGRLEFWCPVMHKFMCTGEMLRQEHWFHNGDGSAQQRWYYTQAEMLDRHGGIESLRDAGGNDNDEPVVTQIQTASQVVAIKFQEAERKGDVTDLM